MKGFHSPDWYHQFVKEYPRGCGVEKLKSYCDYIDLVLRLMDLALTFFTWLAYLTAGNPNGYQIDVIIL